MSELSPEQRAVVESWGRGLSVMAGAGSGKTTTLVIKCQELLRLNPEARFAAVSFTERSASDLREKLTLRLGILEKHWVMTIHGLCGSILREFPQEAGFDGEERMLSESQAQLFWEEAIDALWFDELKGEVRDALDLLLSRESRDSLSGLLKRTRDLHLFGVGASLGSQKIEAAKSLSVVHAFVMERYEKLKRRQGALDFSDLEAGADRALEFEHVRKHYHRRFDLVLVDEFQDTNPVQARIIWRFVKPDASNLCVVGDPKQSIYRFRDADVSVFEEFCSKLPENKSLTWNFRSLPGIIEYSNAVCAPAFEGAGMCYEALIPQRYQKPGDAPVVRLDVSSPAELARFIRAERARGVRLEDMALLLRRIRGNERWLQALVSEGIPIAVGSGGLFWEDPRVREMLSLLRWWANPAMSYSGAVFLRSPWVGVPDTTLDEWVRKDKTFIGPFFDSDHPLARALSVFRGKPVRPGELLLACLVAPEIEAEIGAPLLGLWNRAEELSYRGMGFHEAVSELSRAMEEGRRERDIPPPRNLGQLSVLTLHSSKGLEFDHVILVDFSPRSRSGETPLLFWDRERGAFLGGRDSDGERMHRKDPEEKSWAELERQKNLAESMRLFYVALTRAKERLILVCPEIPPEVLEKKPYDADKVFLKDDWRGWIECAGGALVTMAQAPGAEAENAIQPEKQSSSAERLSPGREKRTDFSLFRPRHSVSEWALLSRCPRAYEWTVIRPVRVSSGSAEGIQHGFGGISQRELGTRVHDCLERGDWAGLLALEKEAGSKRFSAEAVISWAKDASCMSSSSPDGSAGERKVFNELSFEVPVEGEALVGTMDRLVMDHCGHSGQRRLKVVDFKVTATAKAKEELLEAYESQMLLYGEAALILDPRLEPAQIDLSLVHIHPQGVLEIEVPFDRRIANALAKRATAIVGGEKGEPMTGPFCRFCEAKALCPEGGAYLSPT